MLTTIKDKDVIYFDNNVKCIEILVNFLNKKWINL